MYNDVIGVVGGMGSFATVSFFNRLIDAFPAEKELDRPRVIVDNRCTMPSRVRAILYNENKDELGALLSDSVQNLINSGATKIVLACNTSHYFLPYIYRLVPAAKGKIVNIIEETCNEVFRSGKDSVMLIASEGTIECGIFEEYFNKLNHSKAINVFYPTGEDFALQREIIEAVKQNYLSDIEINKLVDLINNAPSENVILGCTEFPIAYKKIPKDRIHKHIVDPLQCAIDKIVMDIV